jgi:AraC-like DNA-binding protein
MESMEYTNSAYPCHVNPTIPGEQFIPENIFIYLITGTMTVYGEKERFTIKEGDYCLVNRNQLAKYIKKPTEKGPFQTFSIFFNTAFLKSFSQEYGFTSEANTPKENFIRLQPSPILASFVESMRAYEELNENEVQNFLVLKHKEILLILLKIDPKLKNILFDFSIPGKIDLESFMNQNFRYNVKMERFAYLTGRSLTAFKSDFKKIFGTAPGRWLLEKRLQEAHFLIEQKAEKPSEAYLKAGFEDLTHFSFAFKKKYGISPSQINSIGHK